VSTRRRFGLRRSPTPAPPTGPGSGSDQHAEQPRRALISPPNEWLRNTTDGGHDGPQFRGPLESALRHPKLAILPIVLLVAVGTALALVRDPVYEAEARINVGRPNAPVSSLDEVLFAHAAFARNYARLVGAEPVVRRAGRAAGMSPAEARDNLDGSPVPESSLISILAEADSEDQAATLANAGAAALIRYVERLNSRGDSPVLLGGFREAAREYEAARLRVERLRDDRDASARALAEARLDFFAAEARAGAIRDRYEDSQGGLPAKGLLQLALPAAGAESDRASVLQTLILIGLGAGVVLGLGLALVRENRGLLSRANA
jgi:hypothetical protein